MPMSTLFMTESSLPLSYVCIYITIPLAGYMADISLNQVYSVKIYACVLCEIIENSYLFKKLLMIYLIVSI